MALAHADNIASTQVDVYGSQASMERYTAENFDEHEFDNFFSACRLSMLQPHQ
jgi:hypothetical protein